MNPFTEPLPILANINAHYDARSDAQSVPVGPSLDPAEQVSRKNSLAGVVVTPWTPRAAQL